MALKGKFKGTWENRVRFSSEADGFAYRPHVFLAPTNKSSIVESTLGAKCSMTKAPVLGFQMWKYKGDVINAVRLLRSAGVKQAQPVHVFFADHNPQGDPPAGGLNANPVYANPVYANPVYANPVYANPVYANPVYANPAYANPVYANPDQRDEAPTGLFEPLKSRVYPNPVYASRRLADKELALRFRNNGGRPSQARPTTPASENPPRNALKDLPTWESANVRISVLDTGFDAVLSGSRKASKLSDFVDEFDSADPGPADGYLDPVAGHGTFIAGIIRRVVPTASVQVRQVLSSFGDGNERNIACELEQLANQPKPPHIVNLSFSGYTLDKPYLLRNAIRFLQRKGIVVVASAGNDGIDRPAFPAAFPGVIAVGALGQNGPAAFSNYGDWVDACAPGVDLTSFFFTKNGRKLERTFGYDEDHFRGWAVWSGTSFAAPCVAGAIGQAMACGAGQAVVAAELLIRQQGLLRIPGYGTVVNAAAANPRYEW